MIVNGSTPAASSLAAVVTSSAIQMSPQPVLMEPVNATNDAKKVRLDLGGANAAAVVATPGGTIEDLNNGFVNGSAPVSMRTRCLLLR